MTKLVRVIDMQRCMGCQACVAACLTENHYTPGARWNEMVEHEVGTYPNARTVFATMGCMHCEDAPCKTVCDSIGVHAITRNALGVVLIDYEKCIGCQYCSAVCPYGVPQYSESVGTLYPEDAETTPYEQVAMAERHPTHRKKPNVVEKCTFCWHKLEPAVQAGDTALIGKEPRYTPSCDLVCPVNARLFGDIDDPNSAVAQHIGRRAATQIKKEFGTKPQVYYVLEGGDY